MEPEQSSINRPVDAHAALLNEFEEMRWAGARRGMEARGVREK